MQEDIMTTMDTEELTEMATECLGAETFDTLAVYYDEPTRSPVVVLVEDMPLLGEYMQSDDEDRRRAAYGLWCRDVEQLVVREDVDSEMLDDLDDSEPMTVARLAAAIAVHLTRLAPDAPDEEVAEVTAAVMERL